MEQQALMLKGYHVLDFTHFVAGPTCTRIMAELGADVIKVERSLEGDHVRQLGIMKDGMSTYYFQHSHSKRSLGVDLRNPRAKELILAMIPKIDVVVENFAPGVIANMGFGYEVLKQINPKIVMCSISATGQTGPLSNRPGYDFIGAAFAGVTDLLGEADRPPIVPTMAIGDVSTGVAAAMAVGYALLSAERNGVGQYLDASLLDTYFHMHEKTVPIVSLRGDKFRPTRSGSIHPDGGTTGVFHYRGDQYVQITATPHQWPQLLRAMKMPELGTDPRFKNARGRRDNRLELARVIEDWLATFPTRDDAISAMDAERVPCAPVLTVNEAVKHPHMNERKTVRWIEDPILGKVAIPGVPVKFSAWPDRIDVRTARFGEDNERVLSDLLKMPADQIRKLYADGILVRDPTLEDKAGE